MNCQASICGLWLFNLSVNLLSNYITQHNRNHFIFLRSNLQCKDNTLGKNNISFHSIGSEPDEWKGFILQCCLNSGCFNFLSLVAQQELSSGNKFINNLLLNPNYTLGSKTNWRTQMLKFSQIIQLQIKKKYSDLNLVEVLTSYFVNNEDFWEGIRALFIRTCSAPYDAPEWPDETGFYLKLNREYGSIFNICFIKTNTESNWKIDLDNCLILPQNMQNAEQGGHEFEMLKYSPLSHYYRNDQILQTPPVIYVPKATGDYVIKEHMQEILNQISITFSFDQIWVPTYICINPQFYEKIVNPQKSETILITFKDAKGHKIIDLPLRIKMLITKWSAGNFRLN